MSSSKDEKAKQQAADNQNAQDLLNKQKKENEVTSALAAQAAVKKDQQKKSGDAATAPTHKPASASRKRPREETKESDATTAEKIFLEGANSKIGAEKIADATGLSDFIDKATDIRKEMVDNVKGAISNKLSGSSMQPPPDTTKPAAAMQNTSQSAQQATPKPKQPDSTAPTADEQPSIKATNS